ncbi:MAG: NADH-quinone oxidoreductase subunit C [Chloroflexi bacterium]|nr:NADH-quinone oxidoreductase subunit C [Chloroflexota bacterium]
MPEQEKGEDSARDEAQEKAEGAAEGEAREKSESPAERRPAAEPKAERAKGMPGGAAPQRPSILERAEAKAPAREPPPPGGIADLIAEALPDLQLEAYQSLSNVIVEIDRDDVPKTMPVLKDDPRLDLKFLRCLFGIDHQDEGLEVVYQLLSLEKGHEVVVKTRLTQDDPRVASVASVWKAADWHERETRDMFGIIFDGHPHLVPLLLPEDMTDHFPLRKDNPLAEIEEWQGELLMEAPGEAGETGEEEG